MIRGRQELFIDQDFRRRLPRSPYPYGQAIDARLLRFLDCFFVDVGDHQLSAGEVQAVVDLVAAADGVIIDHSAFCDYGKGIQPLHIRNGLRHLDIRSGLGPCRALLQRGVFLIESIQNRPQDELRQQGQGDKEWNQQKHHLVHICPEAVYIFIGKLISSCTHDRILS